MGYESLVLKTNVQDVGSVTVCGICRMPNNLVHSFLDSLTNLLDGCFNNRTIIAGDLNLDLTCVPLQSSVLDYRNLMISYGFKYEIDMPTYMFAHLQILINHALTIYGTTWMQGVLVMF